MKLSALTKEQLIEECTFSTSRSSGAGGQNVNKVNTKVTLRFNLNKTLLLSNDQKLLIKVKLNNRLNLEGDIFLQSQATRSQIKNKQAAIALFIKLIEQALHKPKNRIGTKPSKASKIRRVEQKKKHSETKANRKKINF